MKEERRPPLTFQFKEGHYAFSRGWLRNQYNENSVKGKEWQRGWNRAYFDRLEIMKKLAV